ncbi:hypothetical protein, partial [Adlercreutzia equolifaciens]|uniref:hypothetical protein n=1 Tax=Adlercreutzia equolifaciens TaxID=446660 RepID=UPI003AB55AAB
ARASPSIRAVSRMDVLLPAIIGQRARRRMRYPHSAKEDFQRFSEAAALDEEMALDLYANIAQAILDHLCDIVHEVAELPGGTALAQRLAPEIRRLCEKSLDAL